ncbi:protein kinase domain-containing protein [Pyxidicoccus trucidator]|uniref:protein kinase domain-containing protein n=1 Tax=Pyxidicoccus trucidator TaxID=2709662 RepID=UPI0013DAE3EC|nr:protein kinase [Pyxidicoccus trucidator]
MHERYRLVRPLATGGMAELFLGVARTEGFERTVAIKRVLPQLAQEPDIARMFLAEARLSMQLQHQNIATVYDVGHGPGGLFLVMELVDGWDLGVLLRTAARQGQRFPPHLAAFVVVQTLAGLSHAYRKMHDGRPVMVAHRDVSPSNVLVSREGEVKVTDFGIARLEGASFTEPGVFRGKEAYSAPEVLQGAPANALSDQFSLGIVFHELLTGRHPFHDVKEPMAVAYAILSREVPPLPPDVPAPLAEAVLRMMARAPERRFPTPELLGESLARWLARAGEPATSHALSDFMRQLRLAPTLRELGEAGDEPQAGLAQATRPSSPGTFSLEEDAPPETQPGGLALSASGRLVHRCARCGTPLHGAHAPCDACAEELSPPSPTFTPVPPASALGGRSGPLDSGAGAPGPAASASAGRSAPGAPAHAPSAGRPAPSTPGNRARQGAPELAPSPTQSLADASVPEQGHRPMRSVLELPAESLELAERTARPESDWQEDPGASRRRWKRAGVALGMVAVLAAAGAWLYSQRAALPGHLTKLGVPVPSPALSIITNPPGATVLVEGKQVGTTPLAMDNAYPSDKPLTVQVRLRGYRTWKGTFRGGEPVEFKVVLDR